MKKETILPTSLPILRQKAEQLLKNIPVKDVKQISEAEILRLIHELEVHKIELEIQNEELMSAVSTANEAVDLYDSAPTGYFTLSRNGEIKMLNLRGAAMLGKEIIHLKNTMFSSFVSDDAKPNFNNFIENVFHNPSIELCEITLISDSHIPRNVLLSAIVTENREECLLTVVDITVRRQAEEQNQFAHSRFQLFVDLEIVGVVIANAEGKVIETNEYFLNLTGYSRAEFNEGKVDWRAITPPEWLYTDEQSISNLRETGKCNPYEKEYVRKDGTRVAVLITNALLPGQEEEIAAFILDVTERKRVEDAIHESEERYRFMFSNNPQPMWIFDIETLAFLEVNQAAASHYGYSREEFLHMTIRDVRPPEDIPDLIKNIELSRILPTRTGRWRHVKKNGELIFVEIKSQRVNYNGRESRLILINDITDQVKATEVIKESELKYRELIENSPDAIVIYAEGMIKLANKECLRLMKMNSIDEFIGTSVLQFVHPDHRTIVLERMNQASSARVALPLMEEKFIRPDGSEVVVEVKAMPIQYENQMAVQLIIRDITQRKKSEEQLKSSELKFRELFEANADGIIIFNYPTLGPPTEIIDLNENAAKIFGYTKKEMLQMTAYKLEKNFTQEKIEKRKIDINTSGVTNFESVIIHKDKHEIDVEVKVLLINYNNQPALMNVIRDITERKNYETQLQKYALELSKQIAEKDKLFSIIAHDLRGPFTGFMELTELMAKESESLSMDEVHKIAGIMKKSANNLYRLLSNLLEWSRMQRGMTEYDPKPFVLNSRIQNLKALTQDTASKKGISFNFIIPPELVVFADENMLEGVLRNLVANAVKYSNIGGYVTLSAIYLPDGSVEFAIKDNGIGMSKNILDNLFNMDVNTNRKGTAGELSTGLGLIICKDFIEKHNGTLRIESEPGKGSTFFFTIPGHNEIENNAQITRSGPAEEPLDQNRKLNILIAEDDETSDLLFSIALTKISNEIFHAKTGAEAVIICRSHPDIDLIMMDIQMSEMNGYEATRQIRQFNKHVIIIAQTAFGYSNEREMSMEAGCNDYMSKPINQLEFLELIRKHIK